jgi:ABC-type polysaccharide/polyol phosphate export permease
MDALFHQLRANLRLHFRNRMALLYGYLFPVLFLLAFWTLYRYDQVPLIRHMGELLTITVLGGACFGFPTTLVSERERGVWRRFRLSPAPTASLVLGTVLARYVLLISAGLLQVLLAMAAGMPLPRHPVDLWIAFTFVSFAFLGVGLVVAMLADNVPAVQALGQCIFLPMLIVGGVAVPLTSLPPWADRLSYFLPGRYSVEAIQAAVAGDGLSNSGFNLVVLAVIGAAAGVAGAKLFRWDRQQRFAALTGKGWVAVAVAAWIAAGIAAEWRRTSAAGPPPVPAETGASVAETALRPEASVPSAPPPPAAAEPTLESPSAVVTEPAAPVEPQTAAPAAPVSDTAASEVAAPAPADTDREPASEQPDLLPAGAEAAAAADEPDEPAPMPEAPEPPPAPIPDVPTSWRLVTREIIDRDLTFDRLPSDQGIVTPIAQPGQYLDSQLEADLIAVADALFIWEPGQTADPVQRVRNWLLALGMHDVAQTPLEAYLPEIVFAELQVRVPPDDLIGILYWIAVFPERGYVPPDSEFLKLGLHGIPTNEPEVRNRAAIYGVKLLGRLTGHIPAG